ncbi:MAG: hypothetical protein Q9222_003216 [Ikaeria aurantiellina]
MDVWPSKHQTYNPPDSLHSSSSSTCVGQGTEMKRIALSQVMGGRMPDPLADLEVSRIQSLSEQGNVTGVIASSTPRKLSIRGRPYAGTRESIPPNHSLNGLKQGSRSDHRTSSADSTGNHDDASTNVNLDREPDSSTIVSHRSNSAFPACDRINKGASSLHSQGVQRICTDPSRPLDPRPGKYTRLKATSSSCLPRVSDIQKHPQHNSLRDQKTSRGSESDSGIQSVARELSPHGYDVFAHRDVHGPSSTGMLVRSPSPKLRSSSSFPHRRQQPASLDHSSLSTSSVYQPDPAALSELPYKSFGALLSQSQHCQSRRQGSPRMIEVEYPLGENRGRVSSGESTPASSAEYFSMEDASTTDHEQQDGQPWSERTAELTVSVGGPYGVRRILSAPGSSDAATQTENTIDNGQGVEAEQPETEPRTRHVEHPAQERLERRLRQSEIRQVHVIVSFNGVTDLVVTSHSGQKEEKESSRCASYVSP